MKAIARWLGKPALTCWSEALVYGATVVIAFWLMAVLLGSLQAALK